MRELLMKQIKVYSARREELATAIKIHGTHGTFTSERETLRMVIADIKYILKIT